MHKVYVRSLQLVDDLQQLFAKADGVALLDEDDSVEAVADEEDGQGRRGKVHLFEYFLLDATVDVGSPVGRGGEMNRC